MNADEALAKFGGILAAGFGDGIVVGFLMGLLDDTTPDDCYDFISQDKPLFPEVSDEDWQKYGKLAKKVNLDHVDTARIIDEFRKYRPDLLSVICNTPNGYNWLDEQVLVLKARLNLR